MSEDISTAKSKFEEAYAKRTQRNNNVGISDEKYAELIASVLVAKGKKTNKKPKEYWLLKRYDVLRVVGMDKLIRPSIKKDLQIHSKILETVLSFITHRPCFAKNQQIMHSRSCL